MGIIFLKLVIIVSCALNVFFLVVEGDINFTQCLLLSGCSVVFYFLLFQWRIRDLIIGLGNFFLFFIPTIFVPVFFVLKDEKRLDDILLKAVGLLIIPVTIFILFDMIAGLFTDKPLRFRIIGDKKD